MYVYISSKMSGCENFNFDEFLKVEEELTKKGYKVINPVRLSIDLVNKTFFKGEAIVNVNNYKDYINYFGKIDKSNFLKEDFNVIINKADCLVVFGDYQQSEGVKHEINLARIIKKKVYVYNGVDLAILENEGYKFNGGKLRYELLDFDFVETLVKVLTFGASKYKEESWKYVSNPIETYFAALMRHIAELRKGKLIDHESGLEVVGHIACNLMFLYYFLYKDKKED